MIPYVTVPGIPLPGGILLAPSAVLVVIGVALGCLWVWIRARAAGMPARGVLLVILWTVGTGFAVAHLVALGIYAPGWLARHPGALLDVFQGLSSFGGFLGGVVGAGIACRRFGARRLELGDILMQGLVIGWVFGRLGCAIAHDHLGPATTFVLGVGAPGGVRRDLGLEEFLFTCVVLVPAVLLERRQPRPGGCIAVVALLYAPYRIASDFLRYADLRYWGLTPAQIGSMLLFGCGVWMMWRAFGNVKRDAVPPPQLAARAVLWR